MKNVKTREPSERPRVAKESNTMLIEKLGLAQSETKFKTDISNTVMYYYGTKKEARSFRKKLIKCCKESSGKRK